MIEETIKRIEARIQAADTLTPERRKELIELLSTLKAEAAILARTHGEQAQNIVGLTQVTAQAAMRTDQDPQVLNRSVQALRRSVEDFETTHPRLAQIVNSISTTLSSSGI